MNPANKHTPKTDQGRRYVLGMNPFLQWIIVHETDHTLAWSGSRWVPILGCIQICNFSSPTDAHAYAKQAGLEWQQFATVDYDAPPENCA